MLPLPTPPLQTFEFNLCGDADDGGNSDQDFLESDRDALKQFASSLDVSSHVAACGQMTVEDWVALVVSCLRRKPFVAVLGYPSVAKANALETENSERTAERRGANSELAH